MMISRTGRARVLLIAGVAFAATAGLAIVAKRGVADANAEADVDEAAGEEQAGPPAVVKITRAVETELAPTAETPGSIVSLQDSLVAAAAAGKVEWVAEVGEEVEEGDVIARLDAADALLARDAARADIGRLKARADYLRRLVERFEGLGDESGEPEAAIDERRATRDEAIQSLERARVDLRRAETNMARAEVKAPFAGRIAERAVDIGEFASAGAPVARLVSTTSREVTVRAPAGLIAALQPGEATRVLHGSDARDGVVRAVVPIGDEVSRMLELRVTLAPPRAGTADWPIGSAVRVALPAAAPRRAIAAHRDTLILRAGGASVFKIQDDDTATRVDVELGAADGELIELIGDINAGDRLVIRGGERLRHGQRVTMAGGEPVT